VCRKVEKAGTPWFSDPEPGENLAQSHPQAPGGSQDFWRSRHRTQSLLAQQTQNTEPSGAADTEHRAFWRSRNRTEPSGAAETEHRAFWRSRQNTEPSGAADRIQSLLEQQKQLGLTCLNARQLARSQYASGRSCDRPTPSRLSVVFLGP
jgi:hypothetical protein